MSMRAVLCVLFLAAGARAQNYSGRVHAELAAALGRRAESLAPKAELRDYTLLFSVEEKPKVKARLDGLDRAKLSPADLRALSEVYVLLGFYDAGAETGRALQDRDPSGTQGLKLAAFAKFQEKDFAGAAALAREALKINPKDADAAGLLHSAEGRGATSGSSPAANNQAPPTRGTQENFPPRRPPVFIARTRNMPSSLIPSPIEGGNDTESRFSRASSWVKQKVDQTTLAVVNSIDRRLGLRPEEEKAALTGARYGAIVGAGVGVAGGVVGGGVVCAPALGTGVLYVGCMGGVATGLVLVAAPSLAYVGGVVSIGFNRVLADAKKIYGSESEDNSSKVE